MIIAFTTAKRHQVLFRRSEDDKYSDQLFNVYLQMILCSNLTYVIFSKTSNKYRGSSKVRVCISYVAITTWQTLT